MSALIHRIHQNGADSEIISDDDLVAVIARAAELEDLPESDSAADAAGTAYFRYTFGSEPEPGWLDASRIAFKEAIRAAIATTQEPL